MKVSSFCKYLLGISVTGLVCIGIGVIVHGYLTEKNMTPEEKAANEIRWYIKSLGPTLKAGDILEFKDQSVWIITQSTNRIYQLNGRTGPKEMSITNIAEAFYAYGNSAVQDISYGHMCTKFARQFLK